MLYDYLRDIDSGLIKPTEKQHKAMLFLLSPEVSTLLHSPLVKQKQLAYELRVSESFLSTNKKAFNIHSDMVDIAEIWSEQWDIIETTNKDLIAYVTTNTHPIRATNNSQTMIDGVELYTRKQEV